MVQPNLNAMPAHSGNFDPVLTVAGTVSDPYLPLGIEVPGMARAGAIAELKEPQHADLAAGELAEDINNAEAAQAVTTQYEEAALLISPVFRGLLEELREHHVVIQEDARSQDALSEVAFLFEQQGYVREAPTFASQLEDTSRIAPFNHYEDGKRRPKIVGPNTEHEGLVELNSFLQLFESITLQHEDSPSPQTDQLREQARSIRENLTFIGDKELSEAAHGLGVAWKSYLDGDPARKICVLTEVSKLPQFQKRSTQKSDVFLRDKIMATFSKEELAEYGPRISFSLDEMDAEPRNAKVIMLDDWTISGSQMRSAYGQLLSNDKARKYIEAGCLEINVVAASQGRIEGGLEVDPYDESRGVIRVRSYFKAHHADVAQTSGQTHITGLHCAVNYGFYHPCRDMKKELERVDISLTPALTRVCQVYKQHNSSQRLTGSEVLNKMLPGFKGRDARQ